MRQLKQDDCNVLIRTLKKLGATVVMDTEAPDGGRTVVINARDDSTFSLQLWKPTGSERSRQMFIPSDTVVNSFLRMGYLKERSKAKGTVLFVKGSQRFTINAGASRSTNYQGIVIGYRVV